MQVGPVLRVCLCVCGPFSRSIALYLEYSSTLILVESSNSLF